MKRAPRTCPARPVTWPESRGGQTEARAGRAHPGKLTQAYDSVSVSTPGEQDLPQLVVAQGRTDQGVRDVLRHVDVPERDGVGIPERPLGDLRGRPDAHPRKGGEPTGGLHTRKVGALLDPARTTRRHHRGA